MVVFGTTVNHVIEKTSFWHHSAPGCTHFSAQKGLAKRNILNDMMYSGTKDYHYQNITIFKNICLNNLKCRVMIVVVVQVGW